MLKSFRTTVDPSQITGTIPVSTGGTGATTFTSGYLLKGNGTSAVSVSVVYDDGTNVGIGTASPGSFGFRNLVVNAASGNTGITISAISTAVPTLAFAKGTTGADRFDGMIQYINSSSAMTFHTNAGTERMRITSAGEVYIAGSTDQGAYNLQVNGTGVWGAGAYVNGSDRNLKEEISPLGDVLELLKTLKPVTFRYKEEYSKDQSIQPGFIAQDLQETLANQIYVDGVVHAGPDHLNVAYQSFVPLLVKALQEASDKIDELSGRVAELEGM